MLVLGVAGHAEAPKESPKSSENTQSVREKYEKLPCKTLAIAEPVELTKVYYYKDGGTIGLLLTDAKKVEHKFCLDGREGKSRSLFVGVTYPNEQNGKRVDLRGAEESELYGVLLRWVKKHPQRDAIFDEKKDIDSQPNLWEFRRFFLRLDERFTQR